MRGPQFFLCLGVAAAAALPRQEVNIRGASTRDADRPKYSVVPLEPGPQPGQGGGSQEGNDGGEGNGDVGGDDGVVTVTQTVVHTPEPSTHYITRTQGTQTVTRPVPTTVHIIDIGEDIETKTVTVVPTPSSTSTSTTLVSSTSPPDTFISSISLPSATETPCTNTTTSPLTLTTISSSFTLSSFSTITTQPSSSSTSTPYDNGQWHTTYPSWNGTAVYRLR
ncbi:hypothetical protein B0I35DRAFT_473705 [Stachybotrys elegans]|uniref:Uncharacterized protein n=1 Tax=Stachybotrys elegans TaxID=80388 RepID=A0A8K0T8E1_9HYPO|nr:hypothetical protein B0I35DRAFT_473705 [Stachybotrys elegans]